MQRKTSARIVSEFVFDRKEISHLGLESEQIDFMEGKARENLRKNGLPFMGGQFYVDFADPVIFTLLI